MTVNACSLVSLVDDVHSAPARQKAVGVRGLKALADQGASSGQAYCDL